MAVLVICKIEEDPIKSKEARVVSRLYIDFFRCSVVSDGILTKFKLIKALWLSLLHVRVKKIHSK